jgi:WD40 repeat protein
MRGFGWRVSACGRRNFRFARAQLDRSILRRARDFCSRAREVERSILLRLIWVRLRLVLVIAFCLFARAAIAAPRLVIQHGHTSTISSMAVFPGGNLAVTASDDGSVRVWELGRGRMLRRWGHEVVGRAPAIGVSARRPFRVAVGDEHSGVSIFDVERGELVRRLDDLCMSAVRAVEISRDGKSIAGRCESEAKFARALDDEFSEDVEPAAVEQGALGPVLASYTFEDELALTVTTPNEACLSSWKTGEKTCFDAGEAITAVALNRQETRMAIGTTRGLVRVFLGAFDREVFTQRSTTGKKITALALTSDGRILVAEGVSARLIDPAIEAAPPIVLAGSELGGSTFAISTDERWLLTSNRSIGLIWDLDVGKPVQKLDLEAGEKILDAAWSKKAALLAIATDRGVVRIFDRAGRAVGSILPLAEPAVALAWSNDKELWAAGRETVHRWTADAPSPGLRIPSRCGIVSLQSISEKSMLLAFGDGTVETRSLPDWKPRKTNARGGEPCSLAGATRINDQIVLTVDRRGNESRWTGEKARRIYEATGEQELVTAVAASASGLLVAAADREPQFFGDRALKNTVQRGSQNERVVRAAIGNRFLWMLEPDGALVVSKRSGSWVATLSTRPDGAWAAVDGQHRFDSGGAIDNIAWVDGLTSVSLDQIDKTQCPRRRTDGLVAHALERASDEREQSEPLDQKPPPSAPPRLREQFAAPRGTIDCSAAATRRAAAELDENFPVLCMRFDAKSEGSARLFVAGELLANAKIGAGHARIDLSARADSLDAEAEAMIQIVSAEGTTETRRLRGETRAVEVGEYKTDAAPPVGSFHALLVGVDEYQDDLALKYAGNDARDLSRALREIVKPVYPVAEVRCLGVAPGCSGTGTRREILQALAHIREISKADDTILIYLAGHGEIAKTSACGATYYFLTAGAGRNFFSPEERGQISISVHELRAELEKMRARSRLVILDSCRAGETLGGAHAAIDSQSWPPGTIVLAASEGAGRSYGSAKLGHSFLAHAILEELGAAAKIAATQATPVDIRAVQLIANAMARTVALAERESPDHAYWQNPQQSGHVVDATFRIGAIDRSNAGRLVCTRALPGIYVELARELPEELEKSVMFALRRNERIGLEYRLAETQREAALTLRVFEEGGALQLAWTTKKGPSGARQGLDQLDAALAEALAALR